MLLTVWFFPEKLASLTDYQRFSTTPDKSVLTGGSGTPATYRRFWNPRYLSAKPSLLTSGSGTSATYQRFWNPCYLPAVLEPPLLSGSFSNLCWFSISINFNIFKSLVEFFHSYNAIHYLIDDFCLVF